ncbi:hypothetical protein GY45DRAFT_1354552 [Cubamyces sp. BRFM 1775]|nr:hypothetical protein GY45DRAFT_1354552 [Cubamyces sp. BRFM 1775]
MPASGNTHSFVKRGLALDPPLIAGIVVVLLLLNVMLAVAFCALRNRRKRKDTRITHKRRISAPVDCEKYESSVAFAITTGAIPAGIPTGHKASVVQGAGRKSYLELIQALQRQPEAPSPTRHSRGSSRSSADGTRRLSTYVLRPQDIRELDGVSRYPKAKGRVQVLRQSALLMPPGRGGLTRSSSLTDTASVYSSASAPMEYHDQLFRAQPFALDPNPPASAPAWLPELPKPPAPVRTSNASSTVDKAKATPKSPHHTPSERTQPAAPDVSPEPSVPSVSTASLRSPTRHRSRSSSNPQRPQVTWLPPKEWDSPPPSRSRKTSSVSSLSTICSLHEATRVPLVPAMPVMPLKVKRRSKDTNLKEEASPATPSQTSSKTVSATPSLPARSSRRPAASGSEERLP